jgi:hypothetical protein
MIGLALCMAPWLLLVAVLAGGRYPGVALIAARFHGGEVAHTRREAPPCGPRRRAVLSPRGGLLLAAALAGRAPPRAS